MFLRKANMHPTRQNGATTQKTTIIPPIKTSVVKKESLTVALLIFLLEGDKK
jgi:hypothetical protein